MNSEFNGIEEDWGIGDAYLDIGDDWPKMHGAGGGIDNGFTGC